MGFCRRSRITGLKAREGEVYAKNSFGYHVKILFYNEKAAAIIMTSDVA